MVSSIAAESSSERRIVVILSQAIRPKDSPYASLPARFFADYSSRQTRKPAAKFRDSGRTMTHERETA